MPALGQVLGVRQRRPIKERQGTTVTKKYQTTTSDTSALRNRPWPAPAAAARAPPPAQGDRTSLPAVTGRRPVRVVPPAWPGQRGHVGVHQRAHHLQAGADSQGQQPLAHVLGDLVHRHADLLGHGGELTVPAYELFNDTGCWAG